MELLLDFANMTERAVGAKGISPERLKAKSNEALKALKMLQANPHGWPLGWLDLYARNSDVDAVNDAIDYTGDCGHAHHNRHGRQRSGNTRGCGDVREVRRPRRVHER